MIDLKVEINTTFDFSLAKMVPVQKETLFSEGNEGSKIYEETLYHARLMVQLASVERFS